MVKQVVVYHVKTTSEATQQISAIVNVTVFMFMLFSSISCLTLSVVNEHSRVISNDLVKASCNYTTRDEAMPYITERKKTLFPSFLCFTNNNCCQPTRQSRGRKSSLEYVVLSLREKFILLQFRFVMLFTKNSRTNVCEYFVL